MHFEMRSLKNSSGALSAQKVRPLRDLANISTFVETGTYLGETTAAMRELFRRVVSIELSSTLYQNAVKRFAEDDGVHLLQGDSALMLDDALDLTGGSGAMVWLDAHWSGGSTARAEENTPIMNELEVIRRRGRGDDIILIDDIRYFIDLPAGFETHESNGGYPSLRKLLELLRALPGNYQPYMAGDIMIAMPQSLWDKVEISDVIRAAMALRLDSSPSDATTRWEGMIAGAAGEERATLMTLPDFYADSLKYGIGGHFCYWRGLLHERDKKLDAAKSDFELARRCGVPVGKRNWE
ncbi:hypothetical protein [Herbaspirillum rubrisubalbicans]|nr:hypothetical protein [Herbaspirillum rubrisubalbicans]